MTEHFFETMKWCKGQQVVYGETIYNVVAVHFVENLIAICEPETSDVFWVRFENVKIHVKINYS